MWRTPRVWLDRREAPDEGASRTRCCCLSGTQSVRLDRRAPLLLVPTRRFCQRDLGERGQRRRVAAGLRRLRHSYVGEILRLRIRWSACPTRTTEVTAEVLIKSERKEIGTGS